MIAIQCFLLLVLLSEAVVVDKGKLSHLLLFTETMFSVYGVCPGTGVSLISQNLRIRTILKIRKKN